MKATLARARRRLDAALQAHQIHVSYIVRLKALSSRSKHFRECLGLYRSGSGRIGKPIFWINQNMPSICRECGLVPTDVEENLLDTLGHEYGHFVFEWGVSVDPDFYPAIQRHFEMAEEEDFAEEFGMFLAGRSTDRRIAEIVQAFHESCRRIFVDS